MSCIIEVTSTVKLTSEGGADRYFQMGEQFCYTTKEHRETTCGDCPGTPRYMTHYRVEYGDAPFIYWIPRLNAVEVDKFKEEEKRDRHAYAISERSDHDDTTDFIGQAEEQLGIKIGYYRPDIATDPEVEKALGYSGTRDIKPGIDEDNPT